MRLFFAIGLPEGVKADVQAVQRCLERSAPGVARWARPEHMHVTLCFLGEVHEEQAAKLEAAADGVFLERTALRLGGFLLLPDERNPRVIAQKVAGDRERLVSFQASLAGAVGPLAALREERSFVPHVTLGRAGKERRGTAKAIRRAIEECPVPPGQEFCVESFELVSSVLTPEGPRYETLRSYPAR